MVLLITAAASQDRFVSRLREVDGVSRVTVQPDSGADRTTVLAAFRQVQEPERRVFALMSGMGIPILHLSRCEDSLEQVFLNVIAG